MTTTLLGSSATKERMIALLSKFYIGSTISLHQNETGFDVHNKNGKIKDVRVIQKGKRFKFESINDNNQ